MGKKSRKRKKGKGVFKASSGRSKKRKAQRTIRRYMMKVARWERYQSEIKAGSRRGKLGRWDTAGLLRHIALLEKVA